MTIHDLIYELSVGIRLPNPESCPSLITVMMHKCFLRDPYKRPHFKELKEEMIATINSMTELATQENLVSVKEKGQLYTCVIDTSIDDEMRSRYSDLKNGNKRSIELSETDSNVNENIVEDTSLSLTYASLEEVTDNSNAQEICNNITDSFDDTFGHGEVFYHDFSSLRKSSDNSYTSS